MSKFLFYIIFDTMFKTKDLSLAAFLKMKWHSILETENIKWAIHFCFEDTEEIRKEKINYFNNDGWFNSFSNSLKDLKTLIHNQ